MNPRSVRLFASFFLLMFATVVAQVDMSIVYPATTKLDLNSVHFISRDTGFVGAEIGTLLQTVDGGLSWRIRHAGINPAISRIRFFGLRHGIVLGTGAPKQIEGETWDGGATWIFRNNRFVQDIHYVDDRTGISIEYSDPGMIISRTENGDTWMKVYEVLDGGIGELAFASPLVGIAVGYGYRSGSTSMSGLVLKTEDGGKNWLPILIDTVSQVENPVFVNDSIGYALGHAKDSSLGQIVLLKTRDAGTTWSRHRIGASEGNRMTYSNLQINNAGTGYVLGHQIDLDRKMILKTENGGRTWHPQGYFTQFQLSALHSPAPGVLYAVGKRGVVIKSVDDGKSWAIPQYSPDGLAAVHFPTPTRGYAVGKNGAILRSQDGGRNWLPREAHTSRNLRAVFFTDESKGYVAGDSGILLKTVNGGNSWMSVSSGTFETLNALHFDSGNDGYAVGHAGTILRIAKDGVITHSKIQGFTKRLMAVYALAAGTAFASGDSGSIFKTNDGGEPWIRQGTTGCMNSIGVVTSIQFFDERAGIAFQPGIHTLTERAPSCVYRTNDGGGTWMAAPELEYPAPAAVGVKFRDPMVGIGYGSFGVGMGMTLDGGRKWWRIELPGLNHMVTDISFLEPSAAIVLDDRGSIYRLDFTAAVPVRPRLDAFNEVRRDFHLAGAAMRFILESRTPVELSLFNARGKLVWLSEKRIMEAGVHAIEIPLLSSPPSLYFARLRRGDQLETLSIMR